MTRGQDISENKAYSRRTIVKQILFVLIIFAAFFSCLEFILALFGVKPLLLTEDPLIGFAGNDPLFVEQRTDDGSIIYKTAENKLGFFNYQEFPKVKGENTYRIFCLGGSTTFGRPFTDKASFGHWLQAFLKEADSSRNWEVINAGGISYASYRVANLMQELVHYQPDLFIVYSGQNEFLEERSYGSLYRLPSWVIDTDFALSNTRLYSAMKRLARTLSPGSMSKARERYEVSGEVDDILAHTVGPVSYTRDDVLRKEILMHYQLNLERMVRLARDVEADVIFVNPAVNLKDMSPFKSEHRKGLTNEELTRWNNLYIKAKELQDRGEYSEALDFYKKAQRIDGRYAELHFMTGRALFALGKYKEAESSFWRAVDEDIAPLRMVESLQDILSMVTQEYHVPLIDFQSILRNKCLQTYGHGVLGNEFFLDHVHTNEEGYRLLGLALFDQLFKQGVLASDSALNLDEITAVTEQVTSSLNDEDYRISLIHLGKVFDWAGKLDEAKNVLFKSLELFGPQPEVFGLLGNIYSREGNAEEALKYILRALNGGYVTAELYASLGNIYLEDKGDYLAAMKAYQDSLKINYNDPSVHVRLGYMYVLLENPERAQFYYNEALRLQPDFLPAQVNSMALLYIEGHDAEALKKGYKILEDHPAEYRTQYMVGKILQQQGRLDQAAQHFQEALRINPQFKDAQDGLREALMQQ